MQNGFAFGVGFAVAVVLGSVIRFLTGLRKNLHFVHQDSVIPVTLEHRRSISLRTLRERRWRECVELSLGDDEGRLALLQISFHPWWHFRLEQLEQKEEAASVKLNGRSLALNRRARLVGGDQLRVGEMRYEVEIH